MVVTVNNDCKTWDTKSAPSFRKQRLDQANHLWLASAAAVVAKMQIEAFDGLKPLPDDIRNEIHLRLEELRGSLEQEHLDWSEGLEEGIKRHTKYTCQDINKVIRQVLKNYGLTMDKAELAKALDDEHTALTSTPEGKATT